MEVMNTHDQVTAIKVNELTDFHDWDALFDNLYRRPSGFTEKPHVFSFSCDQPTSVSYSMYDGQPVTTKDLNKVSVNCDETMNNDTPISLTSPGMKDIKSM